MIAKTLVREFSRMVAVLSPDLGSPYQMMVFRGINETLRDHGFHVLVHSVRAEGQEDAETLATLQAYRPAGYIVLRGAEGPAGSHLRAVMGDSVPVVMIGMPCRDVETPYIGVDERAAMKLSTDFIVSKGHRQIAYLGGGSKERRLGFVESLLDQNISMADIITVEAGQTAAQGYTAAMDVLQRPHRPTALVCFNDMVAAGAYRAALELRMEIPRDISVMGFDNIELAELLAPGLTTVDIGPTQLGEQGAAMFLKLMDNASPRMSAISHWIQPRIIERSSVRTVDVR